MILYLMRHAHALDVGEHGVRRDSERPLSRKGNDVARAMARHLARRGVSLQLIATSPLLRTRQTADIVAAELGGVPVDLCPELEPAEPLEGLLSWLRHCTLESVMMVGHMPDLAELASTLMGSRHHAGLAFKKAAVCRLAFGERAAAGRGTLEWLLPPAMILDPFTA